MVHRYVQFGRSDLNDERDSAASAVAKYMVFGVGSRARIRGLTGKPELNGLRCVLEEHIEELGRWKVMVCENSVAKRVRVRVENLVLVCDVDYSRWDHLNDSSSDADDHLDGHKQYDGPGDDECPPTSLSDASGEGCVLSEAHLRELAETDKVSKRSRRRPKRKPSSSMPPSNPDASAVARAKASAAALLAEEEAEAASRIACKVPLTPPKAKPVITTTPPTSPEVDAASRVDTPLDQPVVKATELATSRVPPRPRKAVMGVDHGVEPPIPSDAHADVAFTVVAKTRALKSMQQDLYEAGRAREDLEQRARDLADIVQSQERAPP